MGVITPVHGEEREFASGTCDLSGCTLSSESDSHGDALSESHGAEGALQLGDAWTAMVAVLRAGGRMRSEGAWSLKGLDDTSFSETRAHPPAQGGQMFSAKGRRGTGFES